MDLSDEGAFDDVDLDSLDGNHSDDGNARDRLGGMVDTTKGRRCKIPRNETGVKKEKKPERKKAKREE